MKSILRKAALPVSIMVAAVVFSASAPVSAQGKGDAQPEVTPPASQATPSPEPAPEPSPQAAAEGSFTYTAKEGDSLSLFARKSLLLFDGQSDNVSLTPAGVMFAEANIVNSLGGRLLEVGETVTIDRNLVQQWAVASTQLSDVDRSNWESYASLADLKLSDVAPTNPQPANSDQPESTDENQEEQLQEGESNENQPSDTQSQSSAPWYWWLVGAGTLGVLYYLLSGGRNGKPQEEVK